MCVLTMLDVLSAFDTNEHIIILHRLHTEFGFTDSFHQWFSSYLTDRTHYVSLSNHCSAFAPVHSSVPLGSVLFYYCAVLGISSMLFNMYIMPLYVIIDSHAIILHSFADNIQIQMSAPADKMSKMYLQYNKTKLMHVTSQKISIFITYLLQSLSVMFKFPSNCLSIICPLYSTVVLLRMHISPIFFGHATLNCFVWHLFVHS